jgi:hypothetical protein
MAKTGAPPPWLKHVNTVIMLLSRWERGVVLTVTPESFVALAGRCAVFRIEAS